MKNFKYISVGLLVIGLTVGLTVGLTWSILHLFGPTAVMLLALSPPILMLAWVIGNQVFGD